MPKPFDPLEMENPTDCWLTPNTKEHPIIRLAKKSMGSIDTDPCSNTGEPNVPATLHNYTRKDNGLIQKWEGNVFLNPPYSKPKDWIMRMCQLYKLGGIQQGIALLKSGTVHNKGTGWIIESTASAICFWGAGKSPRIAFLDPETRQPVAGANFDCVLVYWGKDTASFRHWFSKFGHVMEVNNAQKVSPAS